MYKVKETSLLCPVCLELPPGNIFQCKNGHSACATCSSKLQACPQCRARFGGEEDRIRNLALEELIGEMEIPCSYKEAGCTVEIVRKELSAHLASCQFRPTGICKLLGLKECDFVSRNPDELFQHVVAHRQRRRLLGTYSIIEIGEILKVVRRAGETIETQAIGLGVEVASPPNCKILQVYTWNKEKDDFSFFSVHFADEEEGCPYKVTISLMAPAKNMCLSWIDQQPVHYRKLEECLNNPPITIPIRFLLANFEASDARVHWNFTLTSGNSESV